MKHLSEAVEEEFEFHMVVRRSNVLLDALRQMQKTTFDPRKRLDVSIDIEQCTCSYINHFSYDRWSLWEK